MRTFLAIVMFLGACATESSERTGDDDAPCTPWTCSQAGAVCGVITDGCGGMLDCGECTPEDTTCVPRTCALANATCGSSDDGCGGTLDCGTCDGGACVQGTCVQLACGDHEKNACGGCAAMPLEPGDTCPCGEIAVCDPDHKFIKCEEGPQSERPPTNDAADSWNVLSSHFEGYAGYVSEAFFVQFEGYHVDVDDTFWGLMQPEMTFRHSGEFPVTVCMTASDQNGHGIVLARCADIGGPWNASGCCKSIPIGQTAVTVQLELNLGIPNPGDDNLSVGMSVTRGDLASQSYCSAYSLQYRF